jgi:hypothetical protein
MKDIQGSGGSWYGFMNTKAMTFGPDLLIMFDKLSFHQAASHHPSSINLHGLAPMGHQEPAPLCSITHQTYVEDIQGSGGRWYGFMTTKAMTFGPDLLIMFAKLSFHPAASHHP